MMYACVKLTIGWGRSQVIKEINDCVILNYIKQKRKHNFFLRNLSVKHLRQSIIADILNNITSHTTEVTDNI